MPQTLSPAGAALGMQSQGGGIMLPSSETEEERLRRLKSLAASQRSIGLNLGGGGSLSAAGQSLMSGYGL